MSGFTLLKALGMGAKYYTLKGENVKKRIRMGITILEIIIWGGKSLFLWSQIAEASPSNYFSDHKTNDLSPQMTILSTVFL